MMSSFLHQHSEELMRRCAEKVAKRLHRQATEEQLRNGVPLFLRQLERTLQAEELQQPVVSLKISGGSDGEASIVSEMGTGATLHGKQLLDLGFTVDQVVHDYGDLCQAITDLALEKNAPFAVTEFRTLNRCLDNAIANAVVSFSADRETSSAAQQIVEADERMVSLKHRLQSPLAMATYAVAAMSAGNLPMSGSTGTILKKSLAALRNEIGGPTLEEVESGSDSRL
jgi:hypothetical protein